MPSSFFRNVAWALVACAMMIGCARVTAIRWWQVPEDDPDLSASLAPSLRAGDWVLLWRLTAPGFGDLVMCPDPQEEGEIVVGRISATGGDTLVVGEDGELELNGALMRSERTCEQRVFQVENPRSGKPVQLRCDIETLGGVHHERARGVGGGLKPRPIQTKVKAGHYFLVSDNRLFPFDSRDYGQVPIESCSETVVFRLVSREGYFDSDARFSVIR